MRIGTQTIYCIVLTFYPSNTTNIVYLPFTDRNQSSKLWNFEITDETGVSDTLTSEYIATSNLQKAANLSVESNNHTNDQIDSRSVTEIRETRSRSHGQSSKDEENGFRFSESIQSKSELKNMQENDPDIGPLYRWVTTGNRHHGNDVTLYTEIYSINPRPSRNFMLRDGLGVSGFVNVQSDGRTD